MRSDLIFNTYCWCDIILRMRNLQDITNLYKSNKFFMEVYDLQNIKDHIQNVLDLELRNVIDDAFNYCKADRDYPFTGNRIADNLLTGWTYEVDYNDEHQLPTEEKIIYRLHKTERQKLVDFINASKLKNIDIKHFSEYGQYGQVQENYIKDLLNNLATISRSKLVYLVLEIENTLENTRVELFILLLYGLFK